MTIEEIRSWRAEGVRVLQSAADALLAIAGRLDGATWAQAVQLILETEGRVVVTGMGKSGAVARKLSGTLASTGTHAFYLHPAEGVHGDLGMLAPGDTVLALSYSGETDEISAILPAILRLNLPIIAVTSGAHSSLARAANVVLDVFIGKEACPMNLAPTTSTTAMIALGDALAITVMVARKFSEEDYAKLHPAGTLGRRLTLRIADIMRTGEAVAIVPQTATMRDTVIAITRAQAGAAIVVDANGKVCGLITDGDIRRHLLDDSDVLLRPAGEVILRAPGVVTSDLLAIEGLRLLDEFHPVPGSKAGEAPVVDENGKPIGMLTLKDLVKAGLGTV